MPTPRLVPSGNPPVSAEKILEKIQDILKTNERNIWFPFSEEVPFYKYIHISRHGEYFFLNRCRQNNSCIRSLNKTLANKGRRWVHSEVTYSTLFFRDIFMALNSNVLYKIAGVDCHHRNHFHETTMFAKLSMARFQSIIEQITISESDWDKDVKFYPAHRRLKKETIDRLEQACKHILNL